jgi:hypothetical protein
MRNSVADFMRDARKGLCVCWKSLISDRSDKNTVR